MFFCGVCVNTLGHTTRLNYYVISACSVRVSSYCVPIISHSIINWAEAEITIKRNGIACADAVARVELGVSPAGTPTVSSSHPPWIEPRELSALWRASAHATAATLGRCQEMAS